MIMQTISTRMLWVAAAGVLGMTGAGWAAMERWGAPQRSFSGPRITPLSSTVSPAQVKAPLEQATVPKLVPPAPPTLPEQVNLKPTKADPPQTPVAIADKPPAASTPRVTTAQRVSVPVLESPAELARTMRGFLNETRPEPAKGGASSSNQ